MAARKSRTSGARARPGDRPIVGDMLLSQADVPDRDDPPVQLNSPRNFFVIDHSRQAQARRGSSTALCRCAAAAVRSRSTIPAPCSATSAGRSTPSTCRRPLPVRRRTPDRSVRAGAACPLPRARRDCRRRRSCAAATAARASRVRFSAGQPAGLLSQQLPVADRRPHLRVEQCIVAELGVVGSAGLVGRNVILTASHVVPWNSGSNWKALFVPAYYDGASLYGASAASWVTSARGYKNHGQGDDMAVMRLAQPLGDWLGYFGYKTYNDNWEGGNYWTLPAIPATSPALSGRPRTTGSRSPTMTMTAPASNSSTGPTPTAATAAAPYGAGGAASRTSSAPTPAARTISANPSRTSPPAAAHCRR